MKGNGAFLNSLHRYRLWLGWAMGGALMLACIILVVLTSQVVWGLERQRTASSDNVQWTLTQAEVEHLALLHALEQHLHDPEGPIPVPSDLSGVRRQFDVFYSRIDTLAHSNLYAPLREIPEFARPLAAVTSFLDDTAPLIDGPDAALRREISAIWGDARDIRGPVRNLSLQGLAYFATTSDLQRADTTLTLKRLAVLSVALLVVLALVSSYLLYVNGITNRRRVELGQANERMQTILSTSLDAVIVSNAKGEVIEFNPAAEAIFGYSANEAKGRTIGDLIVPPELRALHNAGMKRMLEGGEKRVVGHGRVQLKGMRKSGEVFPVELALQSAYAADREIIIAFLRDISTSVAAQEELIAARDRALAGEKAKADFLTVMSHEIRTPLNGLLGNLSLLRNMNAARDQKQILQNMDLSGQVLLNHVDTVLDIARFEAGKLSVQRAPIDLGQFVQDIVDSQSSSAAARGNTIEWQWVGPASPWVVTDQQRLRQVLLNLVGNAIKFTENGRVAIEVADLGEGGQAPLYEFRVIDTGVGIAAADHERIFEDFHTHDPSFGRSAGGTGLGLGIARRFTQAMGGEIGVESTPGEGSVFWVRLPMEQVDPAAPDGQAASRPKGMTGLDLLVVEDNEVNLAVICKMLEIDKHKVTVARNGKEGVDAAGAHRFDAILMDISMPVMDGPTATRRIRAGAGKSANVPILAVSANVLPQAVQGFREAGMDAFVGKPLSHSTLRKALAAMLITANGEEAGVDEGADPLTAMRRELGDKVFAQFLARFIDEADEMMARLTQPLMSEADLQALAEESHKVAGSAAMYGLLDMRDILVDVEMAALAGEREKLVAHAQRARASWTNARKRLSEPSGA